MAGVNYPKTTLGEATTWERTVDDDIIIVNQVATPLLRVISPTLNNLPEVCESTKYEWVEDELELTESTIQPTITAADTSWSVASGEGEYFLAGHILQAEDELMLVTTAGTASDTIVVARGYGYTTGASHTAGTTLTIVGRLHNEGGDATTDTYTVPTIPYNYTQIWQQQFEMTSTEMAILRYGNVNRFEYLEGKAVKTLMKLMERNFVYGTRVQRSTTSSIAATSGSSGGLMDTTAAYIYSTNRNDAASAALTRKMVLDLLQEIFGLVGVEYMPDIVMVNAWAKRKFNDMFETYVRTERTDRVGGAVYESFLTDYGEVDLLLNHNCPASKLFFLHTPFCAIGPLKDQQFKTVELAKTTAGKTEFQVWGEYTQMIKNPKCHGEIYDISTTT